MHINCINCMQNHKMKVLYHSIYAPNPYGHGGEKRSCQLQELHRENGMELIPLQLKPDERLSITALWHSFWLMLRVYGFRGWKSRYFFMRHVKNISLIYSQIVDFFQTKNADIFYWESTRDIWYILPFFAKKYNKRVVAFPHNLEALVGGQKSTLFTWNAEERFAREMAVLRDCEKVYAISNEETWLLQLMGVNASALLYELPVVVKEQCDKVAELRKQSAKDYYLMLGSAINPPTRIGMKEVLQDWNCNVPLIVAGFGTEHLKQYESGEVRIMGGVQDEQLLDLQVHCKALIVNQPATTGALTRIEEFLAADIPIYANENSVRSYRNREGIRIFNSVSEIL